METKAQTFQRLINKTYSAAASLTSGKYYNQEGLGNRLYIVGDDLVELAKKSGQSCSCKNVLKYGDTVLQCSCRSKRSTKRRKQR